MTGAQLLLMIIVTGLACYGQGSPGNGAMTLHGKDERYRIGLQDVLNVQVDRHSDLNQTVPVEPNGTISLFRLDHPIIAACKTEEQLAADIRAAYMENYLKDPQVHVRADQKSQAIYVMGAVDKPGAYFVTRRFHLLEVLAQAGGPTKDAGSRLVVVRGGSPSTCKDTALDDTDVAMIGFKIRDVQEGKRVFWMQPGDIISVLKSDMIYVYGNVNKQGAYPISDPTTLTQALAKAEGLKAAAKSDKIRILRQKGDTEAREELIFDLKLIDKGTVKDPLLEPNDIVAVSQDSTKAVLHGVGDALQKGIPSILYRFP